MVPVIMSELEVQDIDNPDDWEIAEVNPLSPKVPWHPAASAPSQKAPWDKDSRMSQTPDPVSGMDDVWEERQEMESSIAIITARGGSKRIPRKNIRDFCGRPIITYSIEAALHPVSGTLPVPP